MARDSVNYKYDFLPQWQNYVSIEEKFAQMVQSLYDQGTKSLLCGSEQVDDNKLKESFERLGERGSFFRNEIQLNEDECMFIYDPPLKEDMSLSYVWKINQLSSNPYEALCSWQQAFKKMMKSEDNVSPREFYAFHQSTLYLLSTCVPGSETCPQFNPLQVKKYLYHAFIQTSKAFWTLMEVYPPINENYKYNGGSAENKLEFIAYDPYSFEKSKWYFVDAGLVARMREVFEYHFKKNELSVGEGDFKTLMEEIAEIAGTNAKVSYLFPFVCTKLFAEHMSCKPKCKNRDDAQEDSQNVDYEWTSNEIYTYETLTRLFDRHQRKIQDDAVFLADEKSHPVIAFMQDATSLMFKHGITKTKKSEDKLMTQVNTNWLALCLYGSRRFFADPHICSYYCDLTLPVLLKHLFGGEDEDNELKLPVEWLLSLAGIPNLEFDSATSKELHATSMKALEEMRDSDNRDRQLAACIFNPTVWDEGGLNISEPELQPLVQKINQTVADIAAVLKKRGEDPEDASVVVRIDSIRYLFEPILGALYRYLEFLFHPEKQWILFSDLTSIQKEITQAIDSRYNKSLIAK